MQNEFGTNSLRGIDHIGAFKHWLVWLFFFFVGVILFSNWSLHSRLATIESNLGMNAYSVDPEQSKYVNQRITYVKLFDMDDCRYRFQRKFAKIVE